MADQDHMEARKDFLRTFKDTGKQYHRYEVWRDFVTLSACSLHNAWHKEATREAEYLSIIDRYDKADQERFPQLLARTVGMLQAEPADALGPLYMELEIGRKDSAQFFTPAPLSEMMARLTFAEQLDALEDQPFISVHEPACGAGGMVLALVKTLIEAGHDPSRRMWAQCIDVDRTAALMCYIQLSLWNVPAEIYVGNTLTLEMRERWYTPAYQIGGWHSRLWTGDEDAPSAPPAPLPANRAEPPEQLSLF